MIEDFNTNYGKISLYNNEKYIIKPFKEGSYWDINTLLKLKKYINPNCNILEIGGHCGTSTIVYSSFLNNNSKIYVYEPQLNMYNLLVKNITLTFVITSQRILIISANPYSGLELSSSFINEELRHFDMKFVDLLQTVSISAL